MTERTQDLLSKAEDTLWSGDRRTAGILLHRVLLQDINNLYAWQLLHAMLGGGQSFQDFQQAFALKYYPEQAFMLQSQIATEQGSVEPFTQVAQPFAPVPAPVMEVPASPPQVTETTTVKLNRTAMLPPARLPYSLLPDQTCPVCGTACSPQAVYCRYCGLPISPPMQQPIGKGWLLLCRPESELVPDRAFSVWIDGKEIDQIMDAEQRMLSLPAGPHTLVVKSAERSSQPLQVNIKPGTRVRLICQPAQPPVQGATPDLKVIPYRVSAMPRKHTLTKREQTWRFIRVLLIILASGAFIGWLVYIAFYMAWN